ncbi:MAG: restriction endonuclease [Patescibacteria group bacterium]|nr:restriction endonuclease [bacterium]MDZ4241180.1 restriction endonuclease [Patescibacteria group bacterium]
MNGNIYVIKAHGDKELFAPEKLIRSLKNSGASDEMASDVLKSIESLLQDGMKTSDIYRLAFSLLHKKERVAAMRYSLKRALMDLGPSGFPFENFLSEVFKRKGFTVERDMIVSGNCVDHEVDLVISSPEKRIMVEVKFHNEIGIKSDVKVALYVAARFEDIFIKQGGPTDTKKEEGWLITNTKFTQAAIEYGMCKGLTMIGWNYPSKGNLQQLIEESGLHPLTCLSTLTTSQKQTLLSEGVVLCRDVVDHPRLPSLGVNDAKLKKVIDEARSLCGI